MTTTAYPAHDLATMLPEMDPDTYQELAVDIGANGLLDPITLYEGKVLDGVYRQKACFEKGVAPRYEEYDGECGGPVTFVISRSRRRHMTLAQRAMFGARIRPLFEKEAAERKSSSQAKKGQKVGAKASATQGERSAAPTLGTESAKGKSSSQAAKIAGVSRRSVENAIPIVEKGTPALQKAVDQGKISIPAAKSLLDMTPEEQDKAIAAAEGKPKRQGVNKITLDKQLERACNKYVLFCDKKGVDPEEYLRAHLERQAEKEEAAAEKRRLKAEEKARTDAARKERKLAEKRARREAKKTPAAG
jgi:hypothetical protein